MTEDDLEGSSSEELTFDFDDKDEELSDGGYTVEWEALDLAGNSDSGSWSFDIDTVTPDPDGYELDPDEGLHEAELGEDFDIEIEVEPGEDHESEVEALCFVDGSEEDSDGTKEFEEGEEVEFECSIPDDYMDQSVEFEFELVDEAGNDWSSDFYEYDLDASAPNIEFFDTLVDLSVFNDDFDVEYAADDVSGVETVEYYFDDDVEEGDGTSVSDGEFSVDTSGLDSGNNTVYLRAEDEFGRWSSSSSLDFDFRPDESPELTVDLIEELELEAGDSESLEIDVENSGDVYVPEGEVDVSSGFFSGSEDYVEMLPGDSFDTSFELEASEDDIGEHELDVSLTTAEYSETVDVVVNPDDEGQEDIESQLNSYFEEYEALNDDFERLENEGLSEERSDRLGSDISSFEDSLNEVDESTENGDYFEAYSLVDDLSGEMQQAQDTLEEVEEEHQVTVRNRRVVMVVLGLFAVLVSSLLYVFYSEEYELSVPDVNELIPDSGSEAESGDSDSEGLVEKLKSRIEELKDSDEESEGPDYEFK